MSFFGVFVGDITSDSVRAVAFLSVIPYVLVAARPLWTGDAARQRMDARKDDRDDARSSADHTLNIDWSSETARSIGPYRLVKLLGEGGMGEVWLAEQSEPIHRAVALKLIKAGMDTKTVIARFESERQALALMDHPNIARVFDGGSTTEGRPYFVMEFVPGVAINRYCDKHELTLQQRLELFMEVCDGVQHAHQKAIIHRDLKPSNILVHEGDNKAIPKIIDFGLAKAVANTERLSDQTMITQVGAVVGTPEYMSPEQTDFTEGGVDTRTDVYSLGVILYVLLTGVLPFENETLNGSSPQEIVQKLREVDPPRPSTRIRSLGDESKTLAERRKIEPRAFASRLSGELDWITMKALEKERSRRYGSVTELSADIQRYLKDEPVLAGPPSATYRAKKFVLRHRFGMAIGTILFVFLVVFATTVAIQARRIAKERDRANREAATSKRVSDFMGNMFRVSDPSEAKGNSVTAREILDKASKEIETGLANDPEVQARLMYTMAKTYQGLGLVAESLPLDQRALEIRRRVLGPRDPDTIDTINALGIDEYYLGRYDEAEKLFGEVLQLRREVSGNEDRQTLGAMANLSAAYEVQGHYPQAEQLQRELLATRTRILGPEHSDTIESILLLANTLSSVHKEADAEKLLRDAIEIQKRKLGPDHPDTLMAMTNLAATLKDDKKWAEARAMYEEALSIQRKVLGEEHFMTVSTQFALAEILLGEGNYAAAEKSFRELTPLGQKVLGPNHPRTISHMDDLGITLAHEHKTKEAEQVLNEALQLAGKSKADNVASDAWYALATGAAIEGNREQALDRLKKTFERGYSDVEGVRDDDDWKSFRGDPRFEAILTAASNK
jgi:serine/threonine protein kinase/tetratricopeptide (TPR) repeat protein